MWTIDDTDWYSYLIAKRVGTPYNMNTKTFAADKELCLKDAENGSKTAIAMRNEYAVWKLTK